MVLYGLIPLAWAIHPETWLLYVILPVCAAIGMVFQVGYVTVVPALAGPGRITEANGLLYAAQSAAAVAGPLLAGLISAVLGPANAIAVDAASFAVSAVGVLVVRQGLASRRGETADSRAPGGPVPAGCSATPSGTATPGASGVATPGEPVSGSPDPAGAWRELLAGARFLWQHPTLRALTILLTFYIFATQGLPDVLIFYIKHDLHQGDGVVGVVLAVAALGTVAGALLVAPLRRKLSFGTTWTGAVIVSALAIAGLGATGSVPPTAVLAALYLACASVAGIASMSLRQQVTPDHLLGRVTAAFWTIHFSLGPAGAALLTWAAGHYGVMPACIASAATCFLIGTIGLVTLVRRSATRPSAAAAET
jgi:Na+/melibiose symporter-like transporter